MTKNEETAQGLCSMAFGPHDTPYFGCLCGPIARALSAKDAEIAAAEARGRETERLEAARVCDALSKEWDGINRDAMLALAAAAQRIRNGDLYEAKP